MAREYFNLYKKYYDALSGQENMVINSASLASDCENSYQTIKNNYFTSIIESKWNELGKDTFINIIMQGLEKNIIKLSNFIKNNLAKASGLAINSLMPKIKEILSHNDELDSLKRTQIQKNAELDSLYQIRSTMSPTYKNELGMVCANKKYQLCTNDINSLIGVINSINNQIKNKIALLETKCQEANNIIFSILSLNGSLSVQAINSMLPSIVNSPTDLVDYALDSSQVSNMQDYYYVDKKGNRIPYKTVKINGFDSVDEFSKMIKNFGLTNNAKTNYMGMQCHNLANAYGSFIVGDNRGGLLASFMGAVNTINLANPIDLKQLNAQLTNDLQLKVKSSQYNYMPFEPIKESTTEEYLALIKAELDAGRPVVARVTKATKGTHYGTIIGYASEAEGRPLTQGDLLYIDPLDGVVRRLSDPGKAEPGRNRHLQERSVLAHIYNSEFSYNADKRL